MQVQVQPVAAQDPGLNELKLKHCRFCAQQKKLEELYDISSEQKSIEHYLMVIEFFKIDYVDLFDEKLPNTVCFECRNDFQASYNFFTKIKNSQIVLNCYYNNFKEELDEIKIEYEEENTESEQKTSGHIYFGIIPTIKITNRPTSTTGCNSEYSNATSSELDKTENINETKDIDETEDFTHNFSTIYCGPSIFKNDTQEYHKPNENNANCITSQENTCKDRAATPLTRSESDCDDTDVSVVKNETHKSDNDSWTSYPWSCKHCGTHFDCMEEVRCHSKELHGRCYGFNCVDCKDQFNTFNSFVEHVRQHRDELRYYCQHCNKNFEDPTKCEEHTLSHWSGSQKICELCGEICPDAESLATHRKLYKQVTLPRSEYKKKAKKVKSLNYNGIPVYKLGGSGSWENYSWSCQECSITTPDVESLRRHVQEFHNKCFAMKCADCLKVLRNYTTFVSHVRDHRTYLKEYCQYCNQHYQDLTELAQHVDNHFTVDQKPCYGCGQIFHEKTQLLKHIKQFDAPIQRGTMTEEDLTCNICKKTFKFLCALRSHMEIHERNRQREHICDTCGKAFYTKRMLNVHKNTIHRKNNDEPEKCLICTKQFRTKTLLKKHVSIHASTEFYTCDACGKQCRSLYQLRKHIRNHKDSDGSKTYPCLICQKKFNIKSNLKIHMNVHTGLRPYSCLHCEKTFTNWSNCNKHMVRIHSVSLAKTKITPHGRIDINKETGKVKKISLGKKAKEWMNELLTPAKGGKNN